ncbi:MAG: twin-arginine translocase TatA/TatE family subunit [Anaerolineales bacterium]|nr:twin-arginine translocase TatA/TatE family subunit [Anaerolineales bacterium]
MNIFGLGPFELLLVLLIIILLFGVGRIGKIGGELGKGIREFRKSIKGDENDSSVEKDENK